jgi:hypothetical protein
MAHDRLRLKPLAPRGRMGSNTDFADGMLRSSLGLLRIRTIR